MYQSNRLVRGLSRFGAISAMLVFLLTGLGPSIRYGREVGHTFYHAFVGSPLDSALMAKALIVLGVLLTGLAIVMLFILIGALIGSALGAVIVRFIFEVDKQHEAHR